MNFLRNCDSKPRARCICTSSFGPRALATGIPGERWALTGNFGDVSVPVFRRAVRRTRLCPSSVAGGEGGIRTPDTVARMPHFECGAFNHSATSPRGRGGVFENPATRIYVTEGPGGDKAELPLPAGGER